MGITTDAIIEDVCRKINYVIGKKIENIYCLKSLEGKKYITCFFDEKTGVLHNSSKELDIQKLFDESSMALTKEEKSCNLSMEFKLLDYYTEEELLKQIADFCLINQIRRTDHKDGGWFYFEDKELKEINRANKIKGKKLKYTGGYCFLDETRKEWDSNSDGLIRLYVNHCNPKWSFWVENNEVKVCDA